MTAFKKCFPFEDQKAYYIQKKTIIFGPISQMGKRAEKWGVH